MKLKFLITHIGWNIILFLLKNQTIGIKHLRDRWIVHSLELQQLWDTDAIASIDFSQISLASDLVINPHISEQYYLGPFENISTDPDNDIGRLLCSFSNNNRFLQTQIQFRLTWKERTEHCFKIVFKSMKSCGISKDICQTFTHPHI